MRPLRYSSCVLAAAFLAGCAHSKPAAQIAKDGGLFNKFQPAEKTSVVGQVAGGSISESASTAVLELNRAAFPQGAFLVARDESQHPTAVLQATKQARHSIQGVMIVSGQLSAGEEIVEPGPEFTRLVQENVDAYLVSHPEAVEKPAEAPVETPAAPAPASTEMAVPAPAPAP